MLRKMIGVLASMLLVGSLAAAPALATHGGDDNKPPTTDHEGMPENMSDFVPVAEGECVVQGEVHVDDEDGNGGVAVDVVNHNHYEFTDTNIDCTSANPLLSGVFTVQAQGGTDGNVPTVGHGENDAIGWSHSSQFGNQVANWDSAEAANCDIKTKTGDANKGEIWVQQGSIEGSGWVKFIREGTEVEAWGCISTTDNDGVTTLIFFQAPLVFTPTDEPDPNDPKVKNAILNGTATVGTDNV